MGRRKKADLNQELAAPPAAVPSSFVPPKLIQYLPIGEKERWHCENLEALMAEFAIAGRSISELEQQVVKFQSFAAGWPRQWLFVRRLYGIMPVMPPENGHPDDMLVQSKDEICQKHAITVAQLDQELAIIREAWQTVQTATASTDVVNLTLDPNAPTVEVLDEKLLERFGFPPSFFVVKNYMLVPNPEIVGGQIWQARPDAENQEERRWMMRKLGTPSWQKMLDDPRGGELARSALINEMNARRLQMEMGGLWPTDNRYKQLQDMRARIEQEYRKQYDELETKFPEFATGGRVTAVAIVSDMNLAHRMFYGKNDRRLIDKLFTAQELDFLTRGSLQAPDARYRLGWQVSVVEAMHGLYDPNFRSLLPKAVLRKLDAGFKRGVEEARRDDNETLVDLENGVAPGEGDDYQDYKTTEG